MTSETTRSPARPWQTPAALSMATLLGVTAFAFGQDPDIGPPVRIDPGGGIDASNETTAAASDANPGVIIAGWNDWRRSTSSEVINAGFSLSFDEGQTWNDLLLRPPSQNQSGVEGDPMATFDPRTGTLWGGAISFSGNGGLYVARMDPGDTMFQASVMADVGGGIDKCWMQAGPRFGQPDTTRLYIAYNFGIIWSDNMGSNFTNPVNLGSGIGFLPRVGPGGEVYVAYWDFGSGMKLKRSLNDGASFTTHTIATRMDVWGTQDGSRFPGTFRVPPMVYLDVDQDDGTLYACYFDTTNVVNGQRNVDIYFTKSVNQGTTWTTPVVINTDNDPPGDQLFTWLEVDETGRIHLVFFDTRHTAQNDNIVHGMFDVYYMYSDDGGATWSEFRLTENSWDSDDDGLNRSSQFLGDYLGLAVSANKAYPVYLDTSNGDTDVFTRVITFPTGAIADLVDFEIVGGSIINGNLNSLRSSNNVRLSILSEPGFVATMPHFTELIVGAELPGGAAGLSIKIEEAVNQPAGTATVSLFNWDTNEFDELNQHGVNFGDDSTSFTVADAGPYVRDGDGRVELKTKHVVVAPLTVDGFVSRYDLVQIQEVQ